ncbi:MAG: ABC transporter permease [Bacteroidales bacterium]|nr:ABC transporter permease [Bacteroidales bacterium]
MQREIENLFGQGFTVRNKFQQNASVYKMMTYEKLAVYLILLFVVLIISCNVFGSLSMLIIEKKEDIAILQSMGADRRLINGIFAAEGWMISLLGTVIGIIVGLGVCLAQQKFGIVAMPGNFIVTAYPVRIHLTDVVAVFFSVAAIGYIMTHCVKALRR